MTTKAAIQKIFKGIAHIEREVNLIQVRPGKIKVELERDPTCPMWQISKPLKSKEEKDKNEAIQP